jgi:hypothetical protein
MAFPVSSSSRVCTDPVFLLLLIATWTVMTIVGLCSLGLVSSPYIQAGNPQLLMHGVDYQGNICGVDHIVQNLPKRVFPNLFGTNPDSSGNYVPILSAVCVAQCPEDGGLIVDPYSQYGNWSAPASSNSFLNDCIYMNEDEGNTSATTIMTDFARTAGLIGVAGFVLAVTLSLLFLLVVRIPLLLRFTVWTCIAVIQAILTVGALFILSEANQRNGGYNSLCQCSTEVTKHLS